MGRARGAIYRGCPGGRCPVSCGGEVVWRLCLSVIRVLSRPWQPFPLCVGSENLVFPEGARISMRKRCTGHTMAAGSHACTCPFTGSAPTMRHECALTLGSHSFTAMCACVMRLYCPPCPPRQLNLRPRVITGTLCACYCLIGCGILLDHIARPIHTWAVLHSRLPWWSAAMPP